MGVDDVWKTLTYSFVPGESAVLGGGFLTINRYIGFRAESASGSTWSGGATSDTWMVTVNGTAKRFHKVNMGETIGDFTYTFRP